MTTYLYRSLTTSWLTILLISITPEVAVCQQTVPPELMPHEFSENEVIQNIGRLRSPLYDKSSIAALLGLQLDVLKSEIHVNRHIDDMHRRNADELRAESRKLEAIMEEMVDAAEKNTGVLVDRETTNLLMRNCLVELQRIDWDLAAERTLPEPNASNPELEAAKLDILARQAELEAIAAALKAPGKSGKAELSEHQAKLKVAEAELAKSKLKLESLASSGTVVAATRVKSLTERRNVLADQLELLKQQRNVWRDVERLQTESHLVQGRISSTLQDLSRHEIEQTRRTVTAEAAQAALSEVGHSKADEPKQDADK